MIIGYICCNCNKTIINTGYPESDDEYQFCSKKCHDDYIEKHKMLPRFIKKRE
jgi:hypothetical protein